MTEIHPDQIPPSSPLRLLPSIGRRNGAVLLTLPPAFGGPQAGRRLHALLRSLFEVLPEGVQLVVAGHEAVLQTALHLAGSIAKPLLTVEIPAEIDHTAWAQDDFLGAWSDVSPVLLLSSPAKRGADREVVEAVGRVLGIPLLRAGFPFEGGDLLIGERVALVGADSADRPGAGAGLARLFADGRQSLMTVRSSASLPPSRIEFRRGPSGFYIEELFGHTGTHQPLFHLDAFLSLAGLDADGRELVFVGCSRMASAAVGHENLPLCDQSVADSLDEVAAELGRAEALRVLRNPLAIVPFVDAGLKAWSRATVARRFASTEGLAEVMGGMAQHDLRSIAVHRWRAATQNGCVVFGDGDGKKVLLPTYAHGPRAFLAPAEAANRSLWEANGFEVAELPDHAAVAAANGSLHCMVKFLPTAQAASR